MPPMLFTVIYFLCIIIVYFFVCETCELTPHWIIIIITGRRRSRLRLGPRIGQTGISQRHNSNSFSLEIKMKFELPRNAINQSIVAGPKAGMLSNYFETPRLCFCWFHWVAAYTGARHRDFVSGSPTMRRSLLHAFSSSSRFLPSRSLRALCPHRVQKYNYYTVVTYKTR